MNASDCKKEVHAYLLGKSIMYLKTQKAIPSMRLVHHFFKIFFKSIFVYLRLTGLVLFETYAFTLFVK